MQCTVIQFLLRSTAHYRCNQCPLNSLLLCSEQITTKYPALLQRKIKCTTIDSLLHTRNFLVATKDSISAKQELSQSTVSLQRNCMKHLTDMSHCNNSYPLQRSLLVLCRRQHEGQLFQKIFCSVQFFERNRFKRQMMEILTSH